MKYLSILFLFFTYCSSGTKSSEQKDSSSKISWNQYSKKTPCEKLKYLSLAENLDGLFLDSITIDMYKITRIPANVKYGTLGATYNSYDDYKADLNKWKTFLKCDK